MFSPEILLTLNIQQQLFTDPRRIALLKAIEQTGSLSQAAKQIGVSYKTAWDAINEINKLAPNPFLITAIGGKNGGGTKLSAYAVRFIQLYDLLTQLQQNAFNILSDDKVPLDDILKTTARLSLQTSARNQLYGTVKQIHTSDVAGFITVLLSDNQTELTAYITQPSIERLKLSTDKTVLLLIKAPLIEWVNTKENANKNLLSVTVEQITTDGKWSEIAFLLSSGVVLYASKLADEVKQSALTVGKQTTLFIHPQHIIVATLV
ncbi:TOBE domain-containing protein [Gilliamella sp. Pas-s25]|uniref:TOBE domain-containing protein n=1 Tax=Gilliamella sp. Pas-s25 TaxID=2687310 RepID=UPI00135D39A4|nr:TOBE domain-containing protein [Gilliamella sp. Pas-s25]MWP63028.1 LysR family transcriptional regulator [Gilliamella sp. Pas-s25]